MNLCFSCKNCYADRCEYIRAGKPTSAQTWKIRKNGVEITACKSYAVDERVPHSIDIKQLAAIISIAEDEIQNLSKETLKAHVAQHGYSLRITESGKYIIKKVYRYD